MNITTNKKIQLNGSTVLRNAISVACAGLLTVGVAAHAAGSSTIDPSPYVSVNPADEARRFSSTLMNLPAGSGYALSQLNSLGGWVAKIDDTEQWLEIPVPSGQIIKGVTTQGYASGEQWVESYKLQAVLADGRIVALADDMVFDANTDGTSEVSNGVDAPVGTVAIRILPQTWNTHIGLRAGLLAAPASCNFAAETNLVSNGSFESHDELTVDNGAFGLVDVLDDWVAPAGNKFRVDHLSSGGLSPLQGDDKLTLGGATYHTASTQVTTVADSQYRLSFGYSPRQVVDPMGASNELEVYWEDELVATLSGDQSTWSETQLLVTATGSEAALRFVATNQDEGLGAYIDDVKLQADQNILVNGSFEDSPDLMGAAATFSSIPGWVADDGSIELLPAGLAEPGPSEGLQYMSLNAQAQNATVSSEAFTTVVDTDYLVDFAYSPSSDSTGDTNDVTVLFNDEALPTLHEAVIGWTPRLAIATATTTTGKLSFVGAGDAADSIGGLIDDVYVAALPCAVSASDNNAPKAEKDFFKVTGSNAVHLDVLDNDSDVDNDVLIITAATVDHGTVSIINNGTELKFIPEPGFDGLAKIEYTISDGVATAEGAASVIVNCGYHCNTGGGSTGGGSTGGTGSGYGGGANGAPDAGSGNGAPNAGSANGAPSAGSGNSAPNAGSGNGAPSTGSGNGAPNAGSGNGAPNAGSGNGAPNAGSGNGAPNAGSGNGAPNAGSANGAPYAGAGNGAPNTSPNGAPNGYTGGSDYQTATGSGSGALAWQLMLGLLAFCFAKRRVHD